MLSHPNKKGNKWEIEEFFDTGVKEIENIMEYIQFLDIQIHKKKALDFGCGIGRLTQALAMYFEEVYGIDIAPSMIKLAKEYNRYESKCKFYLNTSDDLKMFPKNSFNFIYSNITLQHIKPLYTKRYLKEFIRVLEPNGLLIFQLPSRPNNIKSITKHILKKILPSSVMQLYYKIRYEGQPIMEKHGIRREKVVKLLEGNKGLIIEVKQLSNKKAGWSNLRYFVTKE